MKKKCVSKAWQELKCSVSNPDGKPLSKEKLNDLKKHFDLFPPEARKFYGKLFEGKSEDFFDEIDGFESDDSE